MASPDILHGYLIDRRGVLKATPKVILGIAMGLSTLSAVDCKTDTSPRLNSTQTKTPAMDTPTPVEPKSSADTILEVSDFQIAPLKWGAERPVTGDSRHPDPEPTGPAGQYTYYNEKYISIWTAVRNNSSHLVHPTSKMFWDLPVFIEANGQQWETKKYPILAGTDLLAEKIELPGYYSFDETVWDYYPPLPPGFALPVGFVARVPTPTKNYELSAKNALSGKEHRVQQGAVAKDVNLVPDIEFRKPNEPLTVPGFGLLTYVADGVEKETEISDERGSWIVENQYVSFGFENFSPSELTAPHDIDLSIAVFFKNGEVSTGKSPLNNVGVLPGDKGVFKFKIGTKETKTGDYANIPSKDSIRPLAGAIMVAAIKDQWIAWKFDER